MKKKKKSVWKNVFAIIGIIFVFLFVLGFLIEIFYPEEETYNNLEYENAVKEWENYRSLLNSDQILIDQYIQEYKSVQSASDISYISAKLAPRLDIYDSHLIESRNFLNQYGHLFTNRAELRAQVDDMVVNSKTIRNVINVFVEEYNLGVEEYNRKVQAASDLFRLLI